MGACESTLFSCNMLSRSSSSARLRSVISREIPRILPGRPSASVRSFALSSVQTVEPSLHVISTSRTSALAAASSGVAVRAHASSSLRVSFTSRADAGVIASSRL
jgi:hypothetical protein